MPPCAFTEVEPGLVGVDEYEVVREHERELPSRAAAPALDHHVPVLDELRVVGGLPDLLRVRDSVAARHDAGDDGAMRHDQPRLTLTQAERDAIELAQRGRLPDSHVLVLAAGIRDHDLLITPAVEVRVLAEATTYLHIFDAEAQADHRGGAHGPGEKRCPAGLERAILRDLVGDRQHVRHARDGHGRVRADFGWEVAELLDLGAVRHEDEPYSQRAHLVSLRVAGCGVCRASCEAGAGYNKLYCKAC